MSDRQGEDGASSAEAQLVSEGRFEEAARMAISRGDSERGAEHYASAWKWNEAMQVALSGGHHVLAFRYALESGDITAAAEALSADPESALKAAAVAEQKGRLREAAIVHEMIGEVSNAARLYESSGNLKAAAKCWRQAGEDRKAGVLFEKHLRLEPDDAEASLALGQVLVKFGRWEPAAKSLQQAAQEEDYEDAALGLLVACFDAMHMHSAAEAAHARLAKKREIPSTVGTFLKAAFGNDEGLVGLHKGGEAGNLLAGRYRIVNELGAGASGQVLLGHDSFYSRQVAIKVLHVASGAQGRDQYSLFAREAHVAAGIDHANVVRVFEFNANGPFLVMEYMGGGTLESRLETTLALPAVRHVATSILSGLAAVHRRGVVHRDLKPANVFFGATGDVKLGDFGVAHLQDLNSTMTGAMVGTLAYMSPEQITGSQTPAAATDLYAFGVILFRMLCGELPIDGPDFINTHLSDKPKVPSAVRPELGERFDALTASLLEKDMADRPRGADDVLAAIGKIDWTDPNENALERAIAYGRRQEPEDVEASQSAPEAQEEVADGAPDGDARYLVESTDGMTAFAQDSWLKRPVVLERCSADRADYLRRIAGTDGPYLQAVYDLREADAGSSAPLGPTRVMEAVLERPAGVRLREAQLSRAESAKVARQIESALQKMHGANVHHGQLDASHVLVAPGRAVLLLPDAPGSVSTGLSDTSSGPVHHSKLSTQQSFQDDLRAFKALFENA